MSPSKQTPVARRRLAAKRRGFSLVEMIAATALVAGTLAPALAVMRDAMSASRESARRNLVANYAVTVLEYMAGVTMQAWANGVSTGDLAIEGHPQLRYTVNRSDAPADGGLTGRLMHVQVTVYDDANGNTLLDANELAIDLRTKVAKLFTYENEPN